jgi:hypothetical protein
MQKNDSNKRLKFVTRSLNTPYNWSICLMSFIFWVLTSDQISFYNSANFVCY